MKTKLLSLSVVVALAFVLSFSVTTPAAPAPKPAQPAAAAAAAPVPPHPEIREALESLRKAKFHLEHSAHDFGGHRVEAVKATDDAIRQLQICLEFDK